MKQFQAAMTDARSELGDTYEGNYSYADADLIRYAVDGVRAAWTMRPSTQYDERTGLLYDPANALPLNEYQKEYDIPLPEAVTSAIAYYLVYRCLSRDVTDTGNAAVAKIAKAQFDAIVMG